jgi:hypothetical protein
VRPPGGFHSFLTKLAQAELRAGVRIKAVIGPDTDGGFSIFRRRKYEIQWQRSLCMLQKTGRALERSSAALYLPWRRLVDYPIPDGRFTSLTLTVACFTPKSSTTFSDLIRLSWQQNSDAAGSRPAGFS